MAIVASGGADCYDGGSRCGKYLLWKADCFFKAGDGNWGTIIFK